jgi:hypothetical protein
MISSSSKALQKDDGLSARLKSLLEHVDKLLKKTVTYCEPEVVVVRASTDRAEYE